MKPPFVGGGTLGPLRPQAPQSRASPLTIPSLTAQSAVKKYPFAAKIRIPDFPKRAVGLLGTPRRYFRNCLLAHSPCASAQFRVRGIAHWIAHRMVKPAGNITRPASRVAFRRAAVKPRPTSMSREHPPRPAGAVRGPGALPSPSTRIPLRFAVQLERELGSRGTAPGQTICSGWKTSSNFSAVRKPSATQASLREMFSL